MREGPDITRIAALIGDPARTAMLDAMMSGLALTAGELAEAAGIAPQTASGHLSQLLEARLVAVERQGRHRYFRIASPEVARALEALSFLAFGHGEVRTRPGPTDPALRAARVCYDHLAGALGVAFFRRARSLRRRASGAQAPALPGLSRLERASQPSGRRPRRGPLRPYGARRLARPDAGQPGAADHAKGGRTAGGGLRPGRGQRNVTLRHRFSARKTASPPPIWYFSFAKAPLTSRHHSTSRPRSGRNQKN